MSDNIPDLSVQAPSYSQPAASGATATSLNVDSYLWRGGERIPLPAWWSRNRDDFLRRYLKSSVVLSGIAYSRCIEVQNTNYQINADDPALERFIPDYMELLNNCQFENTFRNFLGLWTLDYHSQDNGGFVEIIGEGKTEQRPYRMPDGTIQTVTAMLPLGNPSPFDTPEQAQLKAKAAIKSFAWLDAGQCWRTGNYDFPVAYQNSRSGQIHILHRSRVWMSSQFEQATELGRGIGLCAASRSFLAVDTIEAMNIYLHEKITGSSPEIGLVSGIAISALKAAIQDNALQQDAKGLVYWKGAALIPADVMNGITPDIKLVGIKGIPDGFNRENEITLNMYMIAMAWGTDVRDLGWPAQRTGQTKADAENQDIRSQARGRADAYREIERFMNVRILPKGLTFQFDNPNDGADERRAMIAKLRAEARAIQVTTGELLPSEAREIAVIEGDIPSTISPDVVVGQGDENQSFDEQGAKTVNTYHQQLINLMNQYRKREIGKVAFKSQMREIVAKQFRLGWLAGAREVGALDEAKQPQNELELESLIDEEVQYIQEFSDALQTATKAITLESIRSRLNIWANQFDRLKHRAMLFFGGDKRLRWQEGDTLKKCETCVGFDGQVRTAREWSALNVFPQDRKLLCGGWNCECQLVVTDEPLKGGSLPPLATKQHHHQDTPELLYAYKVLAKYSHINFSPPEGVRKAAERGLALRSEFGRGGTEVGIARARDLSNGKDISPDTIKRMVSFFARHAVDKRPDWSNPSNPSNGYIAHLLWGGDAGKAWANKVNGQLEAADNGAD